MNWIDLAILGFFFLSILLGFSRGLIREIVSLTALILAFVIATKFSGQLASYFSGSDVQSAGGEPGSISYVTQSIAFIILFMGTILIGAIVGYFLNLIFQVGILGFGNRVLGAVFGFVKAFFLVLVIIFLVQLSPLSEKPTWQGSKLVGVYQPAVTWLRTLVEPYVTDLKDKLGGSAESLGSMFPKNDNRDESSHN